MTADLFYRDFPTYNEAPLFSCFFLSSYFAQSTSNQSEIQIMNYSHQDLHTGKLSAWKSNFHFFAYSWRVIPIIKHWKMNLLSFITDTSEWTENFTMEVFWCALPSGLFETTIRWNFLCRCMRNQTPNSVI